MKHFLKALHEADTPLVMGVINVSPESFYKESVATTKKTILKKVKQLVVEGADIIDVGAMSTAPYLKTTISPEIEAKRLTLAVKIIKGACSLPISIDTSRALPAHQGLKAGAALLNDVYGLRRDRHIGSAARQAQAVILMANPWGYNENKFSDPVLTTLKILNDSLKIAQKNNLSSQNIILDPGIGFFRNTKRPWWLWDLTLLNNLKTFLSLRKPILVGLSRKSFLGHLLGDAPPDERLSASLAASIVAHKNGARIFRTHDVRHTKTALKI